MRTTTVWLSEVLIVTLPGVGSTSVPISRTCLFICLLIISALTNGAASGLAMVLNVFAA